MAPNASKEKMDAVSAAPDTAQAGKPKSSDVVLTIKLVLFAAAFIAALWALDHFASM